MFTNIFIFFNSLHYRDRLVGLAHLQEFLSHWLGNFIHHAYLGSGRTLGVSASAALL